VEGVEVGKVVRREVEMDGSPFASLLEEVKYLSRIPGKILWGENKVFLGLILLGLLLTIEVEEEIGRLGGGGGMVTGGRMEGYLARERRLTIISRRTLRSLMYHFGFFFRTISAIFTAGERETRGEGGEKVGRGREGERENEAGVEREIRQRRPLGGFFF